MKKTTEEAQQSAAEPSSSGRGMVVYQSNIPAMIIEVKTVVAIEFDIIKAHECIEMLIYCLYILRLSKTHVVLGCLTDGKAWHVLKVKRIENELSVSDYMAFSSSDDGVIVNTIPSLLTFL